MQCHFFYFQKARFWWQKGMGKCSIHWCDWKKLCDLKENGEMGFCSFGNFNIALLIKQGWRIMTRPDSLLMKILKAKYFLTDDFLDCSLKSNASYTWRSIWSAGKVLRDGMSLRVGNGESISVFDHNWIPGVNHVFITKSVNNSHLIVVADLINANNRQ